MKSIRHVLLLAGLAGLGLLVFGGCSSTDSGGSSASMYYGVGFYDPWYHGGYYYDHDVIVNPPDRPAAPPRPANPIARPPSGGARPTPMPSAPRPSFRR
jgi:hypothetical protein